MQRLRIAAVFGIVILAGCRSDSTTPGSGATTGTLHIDVSGVPAGLSPAIVITGPAGYQHSVAATASLAALVPGNYHITAATLQTSTGTLQPAPADQDVTVRADTTVDAGITYTTVSGGALVITVSGLPSDTAPLITVTGPGYAQNVSGNAMLDGLTDGTYTVAAAPVTDGGVTYQPLPATQTVTVSGAEVSVVVRYQQATSALTINIDGVYIDQAAQTYTFTVPLVKDRPGLLRVFLRANQANAVAPAVRVRFYQAGVLERTDTIVAHHAGVALAIDEADSTASWNLALPAMLLEPGVQLLVDVDPSATISLATRTGLTYPASGAPEALDVRTAGTYDLAFVPVLNTADGQTGNVTAANTDSYMRAVLLLHPVWQFSAIVHSTFSFGGGVFQSADQNGAMAQLIQQVELLRLAEGSSRYYYGVMHVPYASGQVGLGYINTSAPGSRSAVGWDQLGSNPLADASETYAHELAHNMGLFHAPCGGASSPDPNYPYAGGQVGVYGYNVSNGMVTGLQNFDLMGYCTPIWISDYSYGRLITLAPTLGSAIAFDVAQPVHAYLVSGTIRGGVVTLNPALEVNTNAAVPRNGGPWLLQGLAADGRTLFSYDFSPAPIADGSDATIAQFSFAIPLDSSVALHQITVTGPGSGASLREPIGARLVADTAVASATRVDAATVRITWSAVEYPTVMVRDVATHAVLGFGGAGSMLVRSGPARLEITASDGVRSNREVVAP